MLGTVLAKCLSESGSRGHEFQFEREGTSIKNNALRTTLFLAWNHVVPPTPMMCLLIHDERMPASYFITEILDEI